MDRREAARNWLISTALSYLGTPYRWGGDDPSGFDCSGLVVECLKSVGIVGRGDYTADALWRRFSSFRVAEPQTGCLLFRMSPEGKAVHVALCLDQWFQIGAAGGTESVTEAADAWQDNAFVKIRPIGLSGQAGRYCDPILSLGE